VDPMTLLLGANAAVGLLGGLKNMFSSPDIPEYEPPTPEARNIIPELMRMAERYRLGRKYGA